MSVRETIVAKLGAVAHTSKKTAESDHGYVVVSIDDREAWEALLARHPCRNVLCSWGWGQYKARLGWRVDHLLVKDRSAKPIGMAQVQTRRVFGQRFIYMHGCPLFFTDDDSIAERGVAALLEHLAPGRFELVAIRYERFDTPTTILALLASGFDPVLNRANHTPLVDTAPGLAAIRRNLRRAWSRQLVKAETNPALTLRILTDPDERRAALDAFAGMYARLTERKGFAQAVVMQHFRDIAADDPRFVILEVRENDRITAVRIAHVAPDRLTDLLAASDEAALASSANTLALWGFVEYAATNGLRFFDGGGINPRSNPGVARFKRGLTGHIVQSGPLWLFGRSRLLRTAAGAYLAFR